MLKFATQMKALGPLVRTCVGNLRPWGGHWSCRAMYLRIRFNENRRGVNPGVKMELGFHRMLPLGPVFRSFWSSRPLQDGPLEPRRLQQGTLEPPKNTNSAWEGCKNREIHIFPEMLVKNRFKNDAVVSKCRLSRPKVWNPRRTGRQLGPDSDQVGGQSLSN